VNKGEERGERREGGEGGERGGIHEIDGAHRGDAGPGLKEWKMMKGRKKESGRRRERKGNTHVERAFGTKSSPSTLFFVADFLMVTTTMLFWSTFN
jgi:hypothetical protein